MFTLFCSSDYNVERDYICRVLLKDILGIEYTLEFEKRDDWLIKGENGKKIHLPDILFKTCKEKWLTEASLPVQPLEKLDISSYIDDDLFCDPLLPVIYGDLSAVDYGNGRVASINVESINIGIDLFGSAFFMLTRYEEVVIKAFDDHDRFPASASLAFKQGFLHRPIINEYLELFWYSLKKLFPGLLRKKRNFRILPTHDVDRPFACAFANPGRIAKSIIGDVVKRHDPARAASHFVKAVMVKAGFHEYDPNNTFDQIMDISDEHNLTSVFYFITDRLDVSCDGNYCFDNPLIKHLIYHILKRGHEIGLHGSYHSYNKPAQLKKEFFRLKNACSDFDTSRQLWGIRQHFLRWSPLLTAPGACQAGLNYDTSLGFADHPGFRCGFCYEYPMFDFEKRECMNLNQRPLVAMECSVIDKRYMNLGTGNRAYSVLAQLKESCQRYNGDFTLLWHNDRFVDKAEKQLYQEIIK